MGMDLHGMVTCDILYCIVSYCIPQVTGIVDDVQSGRVTASGRSFLACFFDLLVRHIDELEPNGAVPLLAWFACQHKFFSSSGEPVTGGDNSNTPDTPNSDSSASQLACTTKVHPDNHCWHDICAPDVQCEQLTLHNVLPEIRTVRQVGA